MNFSAKILPASAAGTQLWTDDYSSLWRLLK